MTGIISISIIHNPEFAVVKVKTADDVLVYHAKNIEVDKLFDTIMRGVN